MIQLNQIIHPTLPIRVRNLDGFKEGLLDLINELPDDIDVAEIGCFAGESTVGWAIKSSNLYAVDPWINGYDKNDTSSNQISMDLIYSEFYQRIHPYINKVKILRMSSKEASNIIQDNTLDVVYIDACHTYESVKEDIKLWYPKVRIGGFICGHDYILPYWEGVVKAINECLGVPDKVYRDTSWLICKK